ncbi:MAG: DUF3343 domain-containing protein [Eubacterium sp.]|jgi:hypothetical protein|uniref:DUF3343 domain-containing protein n=1 Tax=Eubacterium sp. F2 TaxID=3381348 RepID=UPI0036154E8A|nr:DUF3343 domain-containing protein [Eubacterium sp.]MCI2197769.1 DUF3343 domain-containing protein [Eubacterium sp.]
MRKKEMKFIVTFRSTTAAMAMESMAKEKGLPGRLVPVPRSISASCGLCWMVPVDQEDTIRNAIDEKEADVQGFYHEEMF